MQDNETTRTVKKCKTQVTKTYDALKRASDGLGVEPLGTGSLAYTLQQLGLVLAYVSEAREALEKLQSQRGEAAVEELARKRLAATVFVPFSGGEAHMGNPYIRKHGFCSFCNKPCTWVESDVHS